jgi:hypothetical protein
MLPDQRYAADDARIIHMVLASELPAIGLVIRAKGADAS